DPARRLVGRRVDRARGRPDVVRRRGALRGSRGLGDAADRPLRHDPTGVRATVLGGDGRDGHRGGRGQRDPRHAVDPDGGGDTGTDRRDDRGVLEFLPVVDPDARRRRTLAARRTPGPAAVRTRAVVHGLPRRDVRGRLAKPRPGGRTAPGRVGRRRGPGSRRAGVGDRVPRHAAQCRRCAVAEPARRDQRTSTGTARTRHTITRSSTSVWVTTTSGTSSKPAGSASARGSTTSEFLVTPPNTSARRPGTSRPETRPATIAAGASTAAKAT